jgi:ABC-type Fe3+/spermidine/putrescine transport system ATPase subunit
MIRVEQLTKTYEGSTVPAVDAIDIDVADGELVTLLGPSGCGKTTTLRSIAGLETPDSGRITIGERVVFDSAERSRVRTNKRNVGMVFQSYAIWPHMTVFENVAYPLRSARRPRVEVTERVERALDLVGLAQFGDRPAPNLSGGQQQRVALARALVSEPMILLFDEPLSNLDAKLRDSMRQEIREVQQRLGIAALYVTHDQAEALAISDRVIVMSDGHILDAGDPQRIYERPVSRFVAEFIGLANILGVDGVRSDGAGVFSGATEIGPIRFRWAADEAPISDDHVDLLVRLEDVQLVSPETVGDDDHNVVPGTVVSSLFLGTLWDCQVDVGGTRVRAHVPRVVSPRAGDRVGVSIGIDRCTAIGR